MGTYTDVVDSGAYVYGTEYEFSATSNHGRPFFGKDLTNSDATCSLCQHDQP